MELMTIFMVQEHLLFMLVEAVVVQDLVQELQLVELVVAVMEEMIIQQELTELQTLEVVVVQVDHQELEVVHQDELVEQV